ncbi:hypothetical protein GCM10009127_08590 [Alteraurantiacibacter aestuarii]|uniref:EF-hand domain-containing protein n=1 Tax=Alteraurantiacibacter aestuarii TaxID=650004 RepID=A0A844ZHJ0_9SPHN|nr:hypothetical protein [Alteraurantiacibacter aestuarii]MXO87248.1 hypothetical protein [Alteraurantiacibacter aestuarii]
MATSPAYAQGGGGGGGGSQQSGPPASVPGTGTMDQDRTRDRLDVPDQDRDRLRDRDRLDTPDRDRDRDRDQLYLGTRDRLRDQDRDHDGFIDQTEFRSWHGQTFTAMDSDNSGGFTLQEFLRARLGPGPGSGDSANRRQRMEERAQARKTERFRLMDGNGDGMVTRTEYMNFGELNYLDADANDDGRLTVRELQQFHRGW